MNKETKDKKILFDRSKKESDIIEVENVEISAQAKDLAAQFKHRSTKIDVTASFRSNKKLLTPPGEREESNEDEFGTQA